MEVMDRQMSVHSEEALSVCQSGHLGTQTPWGHFPALKVYKQK